MSYQEDIKQAALSDVGFDKRNAQEIGNLHGCDPKGVLKEIKDLRKTMKGNK